MAEELCVPAVTPPLVRQIKCFQLFSGDDGGASGVGFGVAAAWSFCFLGFASGGPEAVSRADGGGAAFSSDVFYFSGCRVKLLVFHGDSDEVFFVVCPEGVHMLCCSWLWFHDSALLVLRASSGDIAASRVDVCSCVGDELVGFDSRWRSVGGDRGVFME